MAFDGGFLFGKGTGQTYDQLQRRRQIADAIAAQVMGAKPKTAAEGVGSVIQGLAAGIGRYRTDKQFDERQNAAIDDFNSLSKDGIYSRLIGSEGAALGITPSSGPQSGSTAIPAPGAAGEVAATSPAPGMDKNSVYTGFIGTVKNAGLTNPFGLAAVAATGRAESGYSPQNANRSWADPSESGQAGTAGGIMSWRGPRLQALYQYAASKGEQPGAISPQTQAEFFVREDPDLIASLNSAKSPEEAQALINRAWAFKGYNRPGGEAARRLSYAKGFLPTFQGQGGQEVASAQPQTASDAITAYAPPSGAVDASPAAAAINTQAPQPGYRDPQVNAQGARPPLAPPMPPGQNIAAVPPVASVMSVPQQQAPQQIAQAASQSPLAGLDPRWIQAANNQFLPEEMRQTARMMIQQKMQEQAQAREEEQWRSRQDYQRQAQRSDPAYQAELDLKRAQLEAVKGKTGHRNVINVGDGQLYDQDTGEFISAPKKNASADGKFRFGGNSVEAQALNGLIDSGAINERQAQEIAAGKSITGADGSTYFMTPQGLVGNPPGGSPASGGAPAPVNQGIDLFGDGGGAAPQPAQASPPQQGQPTNTGIPNATKIAGAKPPANYQWIDANDPSKGVRPILGGPGEEIPAEVAARIGLADSFLAKGDDIRKELESGSTTGIWDRYQAGNNQSSPQAKTYRDMQSGADALQRMLTGAGMNQQEATQYAQRYLPTYTDDAASAVSKFDNLKAELERTRAMVLRGRGNMPSPTQAQTSPEVDDLLKKYGGQ